MLAVPFSISAFLSSQTASLHLMVLPSAEDLTAEWGCQPYGGQAYPPAIRPVFHFLQAYTPIPDVKVRDPSPGIGPPAVG